MSHINILLCCALLAAPISTLAQTPSDNTPQTMLDLVNQARAKPRYCGKQHFAAAQPLQWHTELAAAAHAHAQDMAMHNYFDHTSRNGQSASQRIKAALKSNNIGTGENISAGTQTAAESIARWLKSPGHCSNIMNPQYTHFGMALGTNPNSRYRFYWVQTFAYRAY